MKGRTGIVEGRCVGRTEGRYKKREDFREQGKNERLECEREFSGPTAIVSRWSTVTNVSDRDRTTKTGTGPLLTGPYDQETRRQVVLGTKRGEGWGLVPY